MGKIIPYLLIGLVILITIYLLVKNWNDIKGFFGKGEIKECKGLSPFDCVKKLGAKPTNTTAAGRYDYENYGFFSNNRAVIIGSSPEIKGNYDNKQIIWDDGNIISLSEIFNLK